MLFDSLIAGGCAFTLLALGGALTNTGRWYQDLKKPPFQPPAWLFAPAWTVILGLWAVAAVRGLAHASGPGARGLLIGLLAASAGFHALWSPLFFRARRPDWALAEMVGLWASILALTLDLAAVDRLGVLLMAPYLVWVSFALVLNLEIVRRNGPFGRAGAGASGA